MADENAAPVLKVPAQGAIPSDVMAAMDLALGETLRQIEKLVESGDTNPAELLTSIVRDVSGMQRGQVNSMLGWTLVKLVQRDNPHLEVWWHGHR